MTLIGYSFMSLIAQSAMKQLNYRDMNVFSVILLLLKIAVMHAVPCEKHHEITHLCLFCIRTLKLNLTLYVALKPLKLSI